MFVSYVLRVRPEEIEPDRLTAQIEAVATGERAIVHSSDEIIDFVIATLGAQHTSVLEARAQVER